MLWGSLGVVAILASAIVRLAPLAFAPIGDGSLAPRHVLAYVVSVVLMAYAEGYRGFHTRFSPRVVARALALATASRWWWLLFAPIFCMSLFHATRRGKVVAWGVLLMVATLVVLVRGVPQPWRGAIDAGVVVGLSLGSLSILWYLVACFRGVAPPVSAELPK